MKIILVHQYFNVSKGGFRTYSFAKYLVKKGHNVIVVTSNRDNPEWRKIERKSIDGIDIIYIKNNYSNSMGFIRRIFSFLRFMYLSFRTVRRIEDANLIYATSTPLTVGFTGMVYKKKYNKPFVFEVRDLWPELPIAMGILKNGVIIKILRYFEKRIYNSADKIIALSPGMQEGIVKTGYPLDNTVLIPNGCDIDVLNSDNNQIINIPGTDSNDLLLIYAGNFGMANGLDYVIDFARYLKEKNINFIKFILIGDGMKKRELINSANEYNLSNVLFFDYMSKDEVKRYIRSADIGMQLLADIPAFYYGTSPNKFFDYIALSKPVFNNYPGWLADMIVKNNCGCFIKRDNFEEALKKLEEYRNDKKLIQIHGENAFKLAKERFDREKLAEKLEFSFLELLETKK